MASNAKNVWWRHYVDQLSIVNTAVNDKFDGTNQNSLILIRNKYCEKYGGTNCCKSIFEVL